MSDQSDESAMSHRIVYLMRGLPSCGKSHTSRRLAGNNGVICATDQYFYTEVGDDASSYDYDADLLARARQWNLERFQGAVDVGRFPIVVDRGNGLNQESQTYARYAFDRGYQVELCEPDSPWWQEIRVLLKYKDATREILDQWADRLAEKNRATHRTPAATIRRWMEKWRHDITIQDILDFTPVEKRALSDKTTTHMTPCQEGR